VGAQRGCGWGGNGCNNAAFAILPSLWYHLTRGTALESNLTVLKEEIVPLVSVPAVYDGKQIRLLEMAPVEGPYRVLVTFLAPAGERVPPRQDLTPFWHSFGAWQDDRPVEETLRDIRDARRSKTEPPPL